MSLAELKAALAEKKSQIKSIQSAAKSLDRELSDAEVEKIEALTSEAGEIKAQVEAEEERRAKRQAALDAANRIATEEEDPEPRTVRDGPIGVQVRERVQDDPQRGFASLGDFGASVRQAFTPGTQSEQRLQILGAATGMSQAVGSEGGFLVPPQFSQQIWDGLMAEPDNLMALCDTYTVEGESLTFNANAETSRATGSRWGGIQAYWMAEADQMTGSKPKFRQLKLEPQELGVLVYATDKLLRNASALDQYLGRAAVSEIMFMVNDSIINGSGVGKPQGILNASCLVEVPKEGGQAATTIVKKNIDKMWARIHSRSRRNMRWFINQDIEPELENLSQTVGTGGVPVYLPPGGIADTPNARLKGRVVEPIEACPTLGTKGDIIAADMSAYALGIRGGVESAMSMHLRFDYNETAFRFIFAVDGQPWLASAITPFKGSNTLSPFVALATR